MVFGGGKWVGEGWFVVVEVGSGDRCWWWCVVAWC